MKIIKPSLPTTYINEFKEYNEWIPNSFQNYLTELQFIINSCSGANPAILYRGHSDARYLLDSTFVRHCKKILFNINPEDNIPKYIQESIDYHRVLLNIFLLKFGVLMRPPNEEHETEDDIDSWYEYMRDLQQNEKMDICPIKGTFFIDWSTDYNIALFFANYNRIEDGALWICDSGVSGKIFQVLKLGECLDLMNKLGNSGKPQSLGLPLIFHPKQTLHPSALNQKARYIAQMHLRYPLEEIWHVKENEIKNEYIFIKLILPNGTQDECCKYLLSQRITKRYLFPFD
jgi:hypothetical protein